MRTVFLKHARRRKFTELVTDHVLGDENGVKTLSVVHQKRVADKVRRHHRAPRPGLDRFLYAGAIHLVDLLQKMQLDEGSFFQRSSHNLQAIRDPRILYAFFFGLLLSKIKRSLGLCLLRVLNPLASCPHGLTG